MRLPIKNKRIVLIPFVVSLILLGLINILRIIKTSPTSLPESKSPPPIISQNTDYLHLVMAQCPAAFVSTNNLLIIATTQNKIIGIDKKTLALQWTLNLNLLHTNLVAAKDKCYVLHLYQDQTWLAILNAQTGTIDNNKLLPFRVDIDKTLQYHDNANYLTINDSKTASYYIIDGKDLSFVDSVSQNDLTQLPTIEDDSLIWSKTLCLGNKLYNPIQKVCLVAEDYHVFEFVNGYFPQIYNKPTTQNYNAPKMAIAKVGKVKGDQLQRFQSILIKGLDINRIYKIRPTVKYLFIEEKGFNQDHYIHQIDPIKGIRTGLKTYYDWDFGNWQANLNGDYIHEDHNFYISWVEGHTTLLIPDDYHTVQDYSFSNDYLTILTQDKLNNQWHYFAIPLTYLRDNLKQLELSKIPVSTL